MADFPQPCLLCGRGIISEREIWLSKCMIVHTVREQWHSARISEARRLRNGKFVILRKPELGEITPDHIHDGDWVEVDVSRTRFPSSGSPVWGYAIHNDCWQVLYYINGKMNTPTHVQALFDLCRSQPIIKNVVEWYHNYGGVVDGPRYEHLYPAETYNLDPRSPEDYAYTWGRPLYFIGLSERIWTKFHSELENKMASEESPFWAPSGEQETKASKKTACRKVEQFTSQRVGQPAGRETRKSPEDIFQILPIEIRLLIMQQSSSKDVKNLRLASRSIAELGFPNQFWQSRFLYGNKYSYIYPPLTSKPQDGFWKRYYEEADMRRNDAGLCNRRRIYKLASQLIDSIKLRVMFQQQPGPQLNNTGDIPERIDQRNQQFQQGMLMKRQQENRWIIAQGDIRALRRRFFYGARSLYTDAIDIQCEKTSEIWVSLITRGDRQYVSGLQFSNSHIGYENPASKTLVTWKNPSKNPRHIQGLHVALDERGIRGIQLYCLQNGFSNWIGDYHKLVKQNLIDTTGVLKRIGVGLDGLKIVSVSLCISKNQHIQSEQASIQPRPGGMWYPSPPEPPLSIVGFENKRVLDSLRWSPFYYCLFGGANGQHLDKLDYMEFEVTTKGVDPPSPNSVLSILFHYSTPPVAETPQQSCWMDSAMSPRSLPRYRKARRTIDGRNGERIISVDALYHSSGNAPLLGLIIYTNARKIEVPKLDGAYKRVRLDPGEGEIVGFCAQLRDARRYCNFGLIVSKYRRKSI